MARTDGQGKLRPALWPIAALLISALAAAGAVALWAMPQAALKGVSRHWLVAATTGPLFIRLAIILGVCVLGLSAVLLATWGLAGGRRDVRGKAMGDGGPIMIEFALVLPIGLMLTLIMVQSALLMAGYLTVNYSAYCAARSAIVTVPDNVQPDEPPNIVGDKAFSPKMGRITAAAAWAVAPVSSHSNLLTHADEGGALSAALAGLFHSYQQEVPGWTGDQLARRLTYAQRYTEVDLASPQDGQEYQPHEDLSVTVRHTFYLAVPYAGALFAKFDPAGVELDFGPGEYGLVMTAKCKLTNEGVPDIVEKDVFE